MKEVGKRVLLGPLCIVCVAISLVAPAACRADEGVTDLLSHQDLSHFRDAKDWRLVDHVAIVPEKTEFVAEGEGSILINGTAKTRAPYLYTAEEFDDVKVHLEFMVPHRSNAGVYLQGRYEIQIFDSYGVKKPKHSDLGGLYQRWDNQRDPKGYEGVAPKVNAARKPGEWQTLDIEFRGPRFDDSGNKTENARFIRVLVNDQLVHENQEVTGPTRASPFSDEKPRGPVLIQGDHGPLAIRKFTTTHLDLP